MNPMVLPELCPICGKKVYLTDIEEWEDVSGKPLSLSMDCETEPDIDSDEWPDWHAEHHNMPYVDWLPYELRALRWLQEKFVYDGGQLIAKDQ